MEKARLELESEVDIVKIIRSRRYFHLALEQLLDVSIRKDLKKRSKYENLDLDEEQDGELE